MSACLDTVNTPENEKSLHVQWVPLITKPLNNEYPRAREGWNFYEFLALEAKPLQRHDEGPDLNKIGKQNLNQKWLSEACSGDGPLVEATAQ